MAQIITCPDHTIVRVWDNYGYRSNNWVCFNPKTLRLEKFVVQTLESSATPSNPDHLTKSDFDALMPVLLVALVTALAFRWCRQILFNKL